MFINLCFINPITDVKIEFYLFYNFFAIRDSIYIKTGDWKKARVLRKFLYERFIYKDAGYF